MKMTITVDDDLYWRFQEQLGKRRKIQKDAVEEALRIWTEGTGVAASKPLTAAEKRQVENALHPARETKKRA